MKLIFFYCIMIIFISCKDSKKDDVSFSLFKSEIYKKMPSISKIKYLNSLSYKRNQNDTSYVNFLLALSSEYYYLNDYKKAILIGRNSLKLSQNIKDTLLIAKSNSYIGDYYQKEDKRDTAYFYYQRAEKGYNMLRNLEKEEEMVLKKAILLFYEGNYLESEIEVSKVLKQFKETTNYQSLFSSYTLLGNNFERLEEYGNALKYYQRAKSILIILKKNELDFDRKYNYAASSALNLSNVYVKLGEYKNAIQELNLIKTKNLKQLWPDDYAAVLGNLGYAKMKSGNLIGVDKLFNEALNLAKIDNNQNITLYQELSFGEYYLITKNYTKSIHYLNDALCLAQKIKASDEVKTALRLLVKVDPNNRFFYNERYITVSDSLSKLQRKSRDKYARIEYETSVVEDANKVLTKQNLYLIVGSLFFFLGLFSIMVSRYIKGQKREIAFRKQLQKAEEEIFELLKEYQIKLSEAKELEQNRISKELHDSVMNKLYGARMQLGILNDSDLKEVKEKRLDFVDALQDIEQEIRTISHDLHTDILDTHFDYVSLLSNLIEQQNGIGSTRFIFESDAFIDWDFINSLVKITIYRIVQEALSNVLKYAKAQNCTVSISLEAEQLLRLIITDNGVGFDVKNKTLDGIGLKNIKERTLLLKSEFIINSELGIGTSIKVIFH